MIIKPFLFSYFYLAEDIEIGERRPDPDEFIEVEKIPLKTLIDMVMNGEIPDGKSQTAILKAKKYISGQL